MAHSCTSCILFFLCAALFGGNLCLQTVTPWWMMLVGLDYGYNEMRVQGVTGGFTRQDESIPLELIGVVLRMWKSSPQLHSSPRWSDFVFYAFACSRHQILLCWWPGCPGYVFLGNNNCPHCRSEHWTSFFFLHKGISWELFIGKGIRPQNPLTKNIGCGSLCPSHDSSGYNQLTWG